ncbi:MAG: HXXEE domain-containing protein [Agromyces sp.]
MKFLLRHWYDIGGVLVIPVVFIAIFGNLPTVQLILLLNVGVIFIHQFEEYRWPGGEPWVLNEVFIAWSKGKYVDRYPTNELSSIWINGTAWIVYIVAVFFPDQIWLGLIPILMGFPAQFVVHGILVNRRLKTWYNPGLGAVVLGHAPLAIWYLIVVYQQDLIQWWDWVFGILGLGFYMGVVMILIGFRILGPAGANSHSYTQSEYSRWDRERRLTRAGITPGVVPSPEFPGTSKLAAQHTLNE